MMLFRSTGPSGALLARPPRQHSTRTVSTPPSTQLVDTFPIQAMRKTSVVWLCPLGEAIPRYLTRRRGKKESDSAFAARQAAEQRCKDHRLLLIRAIAAIVRSEQRAGSQLVVLRPDRDCLAHSLGGILAHALGAPLIGCSTLNDPDSYSWPEFLAQVRDSSHEYVIVADPHVMGRIVRTCRTNELLPPSFRKYPAAGFLTRAEIRPH